MVIESLSVAAELCDAKRLRFWQPSTFCAPVPKALAQEDGDPSIVRTKETVDARSSALAERKQTVYVDETLTALIRVFFSQGHAIAPSAPPSRDPVLGAKSGRRQLTYHHGRRHQTRLRDTVLQ